MAEDTETLIPELENYFNEFVVLRNTVRDFTGKLAEAQFYWKPGPDQWSVAECISHLNELGYKLLPKLRDAIESGRKTGKTGSPPFRYGLISRWFIKANDASSNFKINTPEIYRPDSNEVLKKSQVVSDFLELQDALCDLVSRADGLDLKRIKIGSTANGLIRLSLGAWFATIMVHEKRHLAQARRVAETPGFSAGQSA